MSNHYATVRNSSINFYNKSGGGGGNNVIDSGSCLTRNLFDSENVERKKFFKLK